MVKSYYAKLALEDLIQIATSDFDKLTPDAKEIAKRELEKRKISIDEITSIEKMDDLEFFKYLIDEKINQQSEIFKWVQLIKDKKLKPYINKFTFDTIDDNLRNLRKFRIQVNEEGILREPNYASIVVDFFALQLYLKEEDLNTAQKELFLHILGLNNYNLKTLNLDDSFKQIHQKESDSVVSKLNEAGKSLRKIGKYLVRYSLGSIGISFGFFIWNPTTFWLLYSIFLVMTLVLFVLIIFEFFSAGEKLIEITKRDFENLNK